MNEWKENRLGDVITHFKGYAFKSSQYSTKGVPIVKVTNLTNNSIDLSSCVCIKEKDLDSNINVTLLEGDIIITTVGSWPNNPNSIVGKVVKVPKESSGALLNQNAVCIRAKEIMSQSFLYYVLRNEEFKNYIISGAQGSANQASITLKNMFDYKFTSPNKKEQKSISEILSSLDDKIELNNKINQELESLAQLLFKHWFVDFEFPNENAEPYKSSGGEMVDSEIGEIPKGWDIGVLSKIAMLDKSNVKPFEFPDKEFYHFSLPDYDNGKKPSLSIGSDILSSKYKVSPNSVLVSKLNPRIPRVWVITDCEDNCICSTEFQVIKPKSMHYFTFLCNLCSSEKFFDSLRSKVTGTSSSHQRVNPNDIINYSMPLPAIQIVQKFSKAFDENFKIINKNIQENYKLSQLRDTLLPKLISGELQINDN
jgi:type I restriction enzyme S subunit